MLLPTFSLVLLEYDTLLPHGHWFLVYHSVFIVLLELQDYKNGY
jgi:hypothetical protein